MEPLNELPTDYREFLKQIFNHKKRLNPSLSFRRFADLVGFKSPNYLQLIIEGKRNLTVTTAERIAQRLKLSSAQREYFVALVKSAAAESPNESLDAEKSRLRAIKRLLAKEIPLAKREIFTNWYCLLVRELFLLKNSKADPDWICQRLSGVITRQQAAQALHRLIETGFLVATESGYRPNDPVLDTNDEQMQASMMREVHAQILSAWAKSLDRLSPKEQELGVLNIPIASHKIPELRRRIREFQDEIIGWVQDETEADRVVQLGTYLIPFADKDS